VSDGYLPNICNICKLLPEWNGKPLILELDHINGISSDNTLSNLRLICPNCHSQTDTFCGKQNKLKYKCLSCGKKVSKNCSRCASCNKKYQKENFRHIKINYPEDDRLIEMINSSNYENVARQLGCSSNAIRRRILKIKLLNCSPSRN
jgi:hypothetical protein